MCGIAGKFSFRGDVVDRSLISAMCQTIVHRGPDAAGIHVGPCIGLGQSRLSIIDLSEAATPPLTNEDESIWLVFNGEIYNFASLRSDLERRGHTLRTHSDTEVILHLYEEYGTSCLDHLRGMFAFALWDSRRRRLFAARDRIGKKPFFYARTPSALTFGSSISALLADPTLEIAPNLAAIDQYLRRQYVPSPVTAFEGINKLPAAHYLICDVDGQLEVSRYWRPLVGEIRTDLVNREEAKREILTALKDAVRSRMVSDVPLGAMLSGGIDSGTVVALMSMESSEPVKTFSAGFADDPDNELSFARSVAKRYGTDHHEFILDTSVLDVLPLLVRHYGEPFADSSALPTYLITRMARQHVTVALTGDGGDESFSGYDRYGALLRWQVLDRIPLPIRTALFGMSARLLGSLPHRNWLSRLARGCQMATASLATRYPMYLSVFKDDECKAGYSRKFQALLACNTVNHGGSLSTPQALPADWMMHHDQLNYLPDCLMVKTDVASMANSLELRSPFLDHKFIELAARIPSTFKRQGMRGKIILKEAVQELLPHEVLNKPKTGFGVPLAGWFRSQLRGMLHETLLDDRTMRRGLFTPTFIRRLVDEHVAGRRDWSNRLWALLVLELWFREFID